MVMTVAKITAGDGYTYLTRSVANGDAPGESKRDATAYYTAQGNPPGRWIGRGAPLLGLENQEVTSAQMEALFGLGMHPDADAMICAYIREHVRAGMTGRQLADVRDASIRHATLGRAFPAMRLAGKFDDRVSRRLEAIRAQTGREPATIEVKKVRAEEARRQRSRASTWCSPRSSRPPCCGRWTSAPVSARPSARRTRPR